MENTNLPENPFHPERMEDSSLRRMSKGVSDTTDKILQEAKNEGAYLEEFVSDQIKRLRLKYVDEMLATGLDFESRFNSEGIYGKPSYDIVFRVVEMETLIRYLKACSEVEINDDEARVLDSLGGSLGFQINNIQDFDELSDEDLTIISSIKKFAEVFEKLAAKNEILKAAAGHLAGYDEAVSGKYIKEYIAIHRLYDGYGINLLDDGSQDSTDKLQQEYPLEGYKSILNEVLAVIEECVKEKEAIPVVEKCVVHFREALTRAKQNLFSDRTACLEPEKADDYLIKIDEVYDELNVFS